MLFDTRDSLGDQQYFEKLQPISFNSFHNNLKVVMCHNAKTQEIYFGLYFVFE